MSAVVKPNYTQLPNLLLDDVLPQIETLAELKVVLAVARYTFGFHRDQTRALPTSRLAELTGLSQRSVVSGAQEAMARGLLERVQDGKSYVYSLVITEDVAYVQDLHSADSAQLTYEDVAHPTRERVTSPERNEKKETDGARLFDQPDTVQQVWDHYQRTVAGAHRRKFDKNRRDIIKRGLGVRTVEECCKAIDGIAASPHHNGKNEQQRTYLEIEFALGKKSESPDARIDRAMGWADEFGAPSGTADDREVWYRSLDAHAKENLRVELDRARQLTSDDEDERALARGAINRLRAMGVDVVIGEDGRPREWTYKRPEAA